MGSDRIAGLAVVVTLLTGCGQSGDAPVAGATAAPATAAQPQTDSTAASAAQPQTDSTAASAARPEAVSAATGPASITHDATGPAPAPAVLACLTRSGGFAGLAERYVIRDDGSVETITGVQPTTRTGRIARHALDAVQAELADDAVAALAASYAAEHAINDGFSYTLALHDAAGTARSIAWEDGSHPPAALTALAADILARCTAATTVSTP